MHFMHFYCFFVCTKMPPSKTEAMLKPRAGGGQGDDGNDPAMGSIVVAQILADLLYQRRNLGILHIAGIQLHIVTGRIKNGQHAQSRFGIHAEFAGMQGDLLRETADDIAEMLSLLHAVDLNLYRHACSLRRTLSAGTIIA